MWSRSAHGLLREEDSNLRCAPHGYVVDCPQGSSRMDSRGILEVCTPRFPSMVGGRSLLLDQSRHARPAFLPPPL